MTGTTSPRGDRPRLVGRRRAGGWAIVVLAATLTLVNQGWVGENTIYHEDLRDRRLDVHEGLLANEPVDASWSEQGHNRANIRVVAPLIVEGLHDLLGVPVGSAYRLLDTLALFAFLLLLYPYLRRDGPPAAAAIGLLFVGAVLPLTYVLHYFHPWDRLSGVAWLLLLMAVRDDRYPALLLLLPLAVAIKFDAVVIAGLYALVHGRRDGWSRAAARAAALGLLGLGTYLALRLARPGGFEPHDMLRQVLENVRTVASLNLRYPPLLMFALPLLLAARGWRGGDRFVRASAAFGVALFVPLFLATNFVEVRAHVPVLLLLLPAATLGLWDLLAASAVQRPAGSDAVETPPRKRALGGAGGAILSAVRDRRR